MQNHLRIARPNFWTYLMISMTFVIFHAICMSSPAYAQNPFAPIAKVNDDIITGYDLDQRVRLARTVSGEAAGRSLEALTLELLIDEKMKTQAAAAAGIEISDEAVGQSLSTIAQNQGVSLEELLGTTRSAGIDDQTVYDQIRTDMAWSELIRLKYGAQVRPGDAEIDSELEKLATSETVVEYLLAEISLPSPAGREAEAKQVAKSLYDQIKAGAPFSGVAKQFSRAPSAANGGDVGWVRGDALPTSVRSHVESMTEGQITEPIVTDQGIVLLALRGRRIAGRPGEFKATYELSQIVVDLLPNAPQEEAAKALALANEVRLLLKTCADVETHKANYSQISGSLGQLSAEKMPAPVRAEVIGLDVGDVTQPIRSNDGFHVIVVCSREGGQQSDEMRNQMRAQLVESRFERLAEGLLRNLRRQALIEQ